MEDENYFFRLSRYSDTIKEMIQNDTVIITPEFRKNEMLAMIGDGLEDVSFSRTKKQLTWGIPVPNDPEHVMYVWCDALTNYISGTIAEVKGESGKEKGVEFKLINNPHPSTFTLPLSTDIIHECLNSWTCDTHVIGKDIARFHCLTWIGMLLSA